jgi:hypothetical protein
MLALALGPRHLGQWIERWPAMSVLFDEAEPNVFSYRLPVAIGAGVAAAGVLWWFHRLPFQATKEERLADARALQSQHLPVGQAFHADAPDATA